MGTRTPQDVLYTWKLHHWKAQIVGARKALKAMSAEFQTHPGIRSQIDAVLVDMHAIEGELAKAIKNEEEQTNGPGT